MTSMVETTPTVTGGVLFGGLRTCQHQHTPLSVRTLQRPALTLLPPSSRLFVCLFSRLFLLAAAHLQNIPFFIREFLTAPKQAKVATKSYRRDVMSV